jgi:hypothetical protein
MNGRSNRKLRQPEPGKRPKGPAAVPGIPHPYRWFSLTPGFVECPPVQRRQRRLPPRHCPDHQRNSRKHSDHTLRGLQTSELRREAKTFERSRLQSLTLRGLGCKAHFVCSGAYCWTAFWADERYAGRRNLSPRSVARRYRHRDLSRRRFCEGESWPALHGSARIDRASGTLSTFFHRLKKKSG